MFREMATLVFFVMTGYKFRPAAANPYFTPLQMDDHEAKVLSDIGVLDGLTNREKRREDMQPLMQDNSD
uniref:Seven transmembrane receptor n=4 Tax=Pararge aegeria TaxID=116150 RepID=S4PZI0_9NEOP